MLSAAPKEIKHSTLLTDQICQRFSLDEIKSATHNFDEAFVVGRGGFGNVYKGQIDGSSNFVAIKRLNSTSNQGAPQFLAEVEMLSKLRHCNLVSLIGYCDEESEMILVYDYMSHGTLEDHLRRGASATLSWLQRLKICIGAARGLDYLHTGAGTQHGIIHRDVKTSNILLDENFAAKISDFGLAKVGPTNQPRTYVSTAVKGTFGYMDPCYFYTGKLTRKSDVYSFGVVLLEVICGRLAVDTSLNDAECGLAPWAQDQIKQGKVNQIIDSRLRGQTSSRYLKDFARIASDCLHNQPDQRPTMGDIVFRLERIRSLQERLDSSVTEGKFMEKVIFFFSTKVESKTSNEGRDTSDSDSGRTGVHVNNAVITTREAKVDLSKKGVLKLNHTSGSEEEPSNKAGRDTSDWVRAIPRGPGNLTNGTLKSFSYNVLKSATRNFNTDYILGEGSCGYVFKGWIDEQSLEAAKPGTGSAVAVKILDNEYFNGRAEWLAEEKYLGQLNHPNLVKLIGYRLEDDHRLLVYEFMPKGTLENRLFRRRYLEPLHWNKRIQIVLDAAKGLAYLHSQAPQVVYCGLTAESILMDYNYNAKLSNFGLTGVEEIVPLSPPYHLQTSRYKQNDGYADPEYIETGVLTARSHIYSLGVVLLELLTGMRCIDQNRPSHMINLLDFAMPYFTDEQKISKIIDPRMHGHCSKSVATRAAKLAMKCLSRNPSDRPTADKVVKELEELQNKQKTADDDKKQRRAKRR